MCLVSIVITTKNEGLNIANCLISVKQQSWDNTEIIVVDNSSTDNTRDIALDFTPHVYLKGPERSAQRNFGINQASGKYVIYLDADMILSEHVIRDCVSTFEADSNIIGAYISEKIMGDSYWSKVRKFERSFYDGTVIDCVRFMRRDVFLKLDGFDETMSGPEDWDLDKKFRLSGECVLVKTPIFHNESDFNIAGYLKKKSYYAKSFKNYIDKWGRNDVDVHRQFSLFYRYLGIFTENGKWRKLIRHPMLLMGMYFLRFLVGVSYLRSKIV